MMRCRRITWSVVVLMLLALATGGCGGGEAKGEKQAGASADSTKTDSTQVDSAKVAKKDAKKDDKKKKVREGVPVKVVPLALGEISEHVLYSATVEAEETIDVYAQASGLVRKVLAEEGDWVKEGQVLVELVDDELKLNETEAKLAFQKLQNQFNRKSEMFSRELLSKEEYEDLKINMEQARIRWERAKLSLAHAQARSPVEGVISNRLVKLGDRIGQSSKLYELVNMQSLIARVHVPGQGMRNLAVGQRAKVTTDFLPDTTFTGRILRISPVVDPGSGTFKVTLELDTQSGGLRPGMFVNTHIVTATRSDAVLVPKRAVVYDDGMPHVFVVEDSTASKVRFEMGFDDTEHIEAVSGVTRGDMIVVVGQNGLKDQAKVRIIEGEGLRIPAKVDSAKGEDKAS